MKKLLLLAVLIFLGVSSYAQQVVEVKNASPCDVHLRVENHKICDVTPIFESITVPSGGVINVNTISPDYTEITGIYIITNSNSLPASVNPGCLKCPSYIIGPDQGNWIENNGCTSNPLNYFYEWSCVDPGYSSQLYIGI